MNIGRPESEWITRAQAQQEMDRGLAAFEDDDWARAHGRNDLFERFLAEELANAPAGTFMDNHGQTHALFAPTEESRADSQAGLLSLFKDYGGGNGQVGNYVSNLWVPVDGAADRYRQGHQQGVGQSGADATLAGDAVTLFEGVIGHFFRLSFFAPFRSSCSLED